MRLPLDGGWRAPQVQRKRKLRVDLHRRRLDPTWRMPKREESRVPACFRFVRVYWKCFVGTSARVHHMISTSTHRTAGGCVDDLQRQRRMDRNRGMQAPGRLPRPVSHPTNEFALGSCRMQRQTTSVAKNRESFAYKPFHANLQAFN